MHISVPPWQRLYQSFGVKIGTIHQAWLHRVEVVGCCCADDGWETVGKKTKGSAKIDGQNHNSAFFGEYHPMAVGQAGARTAAPAPSAQPAAAVPGPAAAPAADPAPAPRHVPARAIQMAIRTARSVMRLPTSFFSICVSSP